MSQLESPLQTPPKVMVSFWTHTLRNREPHTLKGNWIHNGTTLIVKMSIITLSWNLPISPTYVLWSDTEQVKSLFHKLVLPISEDRGRAHPQTLFLFKCVCSSLSVDLDLTILVAFCLPSVPAVPKWASDPNGPLQTWAVQNRAGCPSWLPIWF